VTWWVVVAGLLVEFPVVRWSFRLPLRKAILADVTMNAASTILGTICLAIAGLIWEVFPGIMLYEGFHIGTFNPITWSVTFILAAVINTWIEAMVLRAGFGCRLERRRIVALFLANAVTVALAAIQLRWGPHTL